MIQTYLSLVLHDTIGLITILNPIAAASIMVTMVDNTTPSTMRSVAFKATMTVFIASLVTLFGGEFIFKIFGINVMSIKVIGGVILMLIAINMAYGQSSKSRHTQAEHDEAEEKEDVSIVPIGIPILFGPGVIATIIVLNNNISGEYSHLVSYSIVSISLLIAAITIFFTLRYAGAIHKVLGITGMKILMRIMGLVVGAIAAQFLIGGIKGLWGQ